MAIVISVLVGVAVVCLFVFALLGTRGSWVGAEGWSSLARWTRRRERLLRAIRDLDFEKDSGLLSADEHAALRADWESRLVETTRTLERLRRARFRSVVARRRGSPSASRRRIEELVAAKRKALAGAGPAGSPPPLPATAVIQTRKE